MSFYCHELLKTVLLALNLVLENNKQLFDLCGCVFFTLKKSEISVILTI